MRRVLCYGDSNTHGTLPMADLADRRRLPRAARWPGLLAAALGPGGEVIEEGLPSRTTVLDDPVEGEDRNGLRFLPVALASHAPLDLVVLMLGTNDTKARFGLPPSDIALGAERLLAAIRASGAGPGGAAPRILLLAPAPVEERGCLAAMFAGAAARSRALAPLLAGAAARAGADFLDAGAHVAVSPLDGVHLDAPAHAVLGAAVSAAIAGILPAPDMEMPRP